MASTRHYGRASALAFGLAVICCSGALQAQQQNEGPSTQFGLTTGVMFNDNRGLDDDSLGSTTELVTRLDFTLRFATPIQDLELTGDIGLRTVNGAERDNLPGGFNDPNIRLSYGRQSRDAALDVTVFASERDVISTSLQLIEDTSNFELLSDIGSVLRFGFDTDLELRRRAPFGVTLSAGFTGLRYSDDASADLTDQDRFRIGALFRLDLDPATRATLNARLTTFEDDGTPEGRRDTYTLDGLLRRNLRNGSATARAVAVSTEDGKRYTLSVGRSIETELWDVSGTAGVTRGVEGDLSAIGTIDVTRTLKNGSWSANFSRAVVSSSDDQQQDITALGLGYSTQLDALTLFSTNLSYTDRSDTDAGGGGSLGLLGLTVQHTLTEDWRLDVGLQHRVNKNTAGIRARDNQISISLRRDFFARR